MVTVVPRLLDARGCEWDGGPATTLRVRVVPALGAVA